MIAKFTIPNDLISQPHSLILFEEPNPICLKIYAGLPRECCSYYPKILIGWIFLQKFIQVYQSQQIKKLTSEPHTLTMQYSYCGDLVWFKVT